MFQGKFGAVSPKPTSWMVARAPAFSKFLAQFASTMTRGTSIGLRADGEGFQTSGLKEYPPDLCGCIALTLLEEAMAAELDGSKFHHMDTVLKIMVVPLDPYFEMDLDFGGGQLLAEDE